MDVDIPAGAFDGADALTDLLVLMDCFIAGQHDWQASEAAVEAAKVYFAENAPRRAQELAALGSKGFVDTVAWSGRKAAVVRVQRATLHAQVADLSAPAVLVVENATGDGGFVTVVAKAFRAVEVTAALSNLWLRIVHGGGQTTEDVASGWVAEFHHHPRVVVLIDSDRLVPGQRTSAHDKAERLRSLGAVVHVLELRESENYIPHRVLSALGGNSKAGRKRATKRVEMLRKLTPQQRGHFDMKKGFGPNGSPPAVHPDQTILYSGIETEVLLVLRDGFGQKVLEKIHMLGDLHERDFVQLGDDVAEELQRLLASIRSVL